MDHVRALVARHFAGSGSTLSIGGIPATALAASHGTPLFVYDAGILDRQLALLRATYPPEFDIAYSIKANPCPAIVRHFVAAGLGLEVASAGEFHQTQRAGCPPGRVLFAGPGKTETELAYVLERGIGEIHVESEREAERVEEIAARLGVRARVALRINPGPDAQGGAMRMGGKPAPFGVDEERIDPVVDRLAKSAHVEFQGIHLFTGTQILDDGVLVHQYRKGVEIARRVAGRIGRPLQVVDFGGGLGIPYFPSESPLPMDRLAEGLRALAAEVRADARLRGTRLLIEPGRYLAGEAGVYLTRVNDIKESRGKTFLIVDGGMNHHLAASGNLGQVIKRNFPIAVANRLEEPAGAAVDVVGPLCTPLDVLARDVTLPEARVGDLVAIFQSGAYGRTASPLGFLSQPSPAEVFVHDGSATLVRRRGTYEDALWDAVGS
ncbi:MAG TPA: diaminopimelate decarboxylase [Candidatus Eisenbacteria bacterium]|nr:diaminopimelate decarboxylase [Candidatus Eisenbacteria bacterium]